MIGSNPDVGFTLKSFFFQAEDGIRDRTVTGVQTCALPISRPAAVGGGRAGDRGLCRPLRPRRQDAGRCGEGSGREEVIDVDTLQFLAAPFAADRKSVV